jgi:hypothetical protein
VNGLSRKAISAVAIALAVTSLSACANPTGAAFDRLALTRARARWTAQGITDYTMEARELCFCPPGFGQWMEITVRGGVVVSSRPIDLVPVAAQGPRRTVQEMFEFIGADHSGDSFPVRVEVEYDPEFGYPRSINLTTSAQVADFGLTIQARNLKRGAGGG